jgi:thiamine-phosphate pyrophosphorylase
MTRLAASRSVRERLDRVRIYLITGAQPGMRPLEQLVREAIAGGVGMVQLREKAMSDAELFDVARRCAAACTNAGVPFIVNNRIDVALACGADGVHLGQDDLPVGAARRLGGPAFIIGLSTHSREQIDEASKNCADYIGVGPVHATPTKPGRAPVGTELVRYAAAHAALPFFAIGGIDAGNVASVVADGARGISVLRAITAASDPRAAARALLDRLEQAQAVRAAAGR